MSVITLKLIVAAMKSHTQNLAKRRRNQIESICQLNLCEKLVVVSTLRNVKNTSMIDSLRDSLENKWNK